MSNQIEMMAEFALQPVSGKFSAALSNQLKRHLLDSLASLIFSTGESTPLQVAQALQTLTGLQPPAFPMKLPASYAAQYYTSLIRYPDFMDNFLAKESTCHPSDNIGALLAAAHQRDISGKDFLDALAVAYEMECRLTQELPVMIKGYDHTALLAFSATAGICRLLGLSLTQTMHALSIAGCSFNPLVSSRASYTSQWKGLASSLVNEGCMNICMLAQQGVTGPVQLFEIPEKGYNDIYGMQLDYNWPEDKFDLIPRCMLKSYNAEVHTQSAIAAALSLKEEHAIDARQVKNMDVTIFLTAYHIVGGGEYGDRKVVQSKEQADHSLPYLLAVALLDGGVMPPQLTPERITRADVQELLQKVNVHTRFPVHKPVKVAGMLDGYTAAYPGKLKCTVTISLDDGRELSCEQEDYRGFYTRPLTWEEVTQKFTILTQGRIPEESGHKIIQAVEDIENIPVRGLLRLLFNS
jgi:2-methylcitrate dehydratase